MSKQTLRIRWARLFGVVLMIAGLLIYVRYRSALPELVTVFTRGGHAATHADRMFALLSLGIVAVTFIAALRLILDYRSNRP